MDNNLHGPSKRLRLASNNVNTETVEATEATEAVEPVEPVEPVEATEAEIWKPSNYVRSRT
ncbi:hypothetical protein LY76DRAFT_651811 [Colletotrichum caudatum]|nr:hypothetical protein LY76DRAFT_651811 [Colletotrichum caudatum]